MTESAGVGTQVIAIDGPAGSGKSTVARMVARRLNLPYLDTGAMYRSVTLAALRRGVDMSDVEKLTALASNVEIKMNERFDNDNTAQTVLIDGVESAAEIRGPEVSMNVSAVAALPTVRKELVARQRDWAQERGGGVVEGRDIAAIVFPDAKLKVHLTASPEERARRRISQASTASDDNAAASDVERRDKSDMYPATDPGASGADAVVIDTTNISIEEVVERIMELA